MPMASETPTTLKLSEEAATVVGRSFNSSRVPPCPDPHPETGVSSKDVTISLSPPLSARLYLPKLHDHPGRQKVPVLVYFHGGGFISESAFSFLDTRFLSRLVSEANTIAISVEYRLAPEHPLPIPYEDCWAVLQWVTSHSMGLEPELEKDLWLLNHADFDRVFVGGDSAGGNIAHNIAMRAGSEELNGGVKLKGAFLTHPFFWSPNPMGTSDSIEEHEKKPMSKVWRLVYPTAEGGLDNAALNPVGEGKASLATLGCRRMLVCVAEKDEYELRERGVCYYEKVKESGWEGELELVEAMGELHSCHILSPHRENAAALIRKLASFLRNK